MNRVNVVGNKPKNKPLPVWLRLEQKATISGSFSHRKWLVFRLGVETEAIGTHICMNRVNFVRNKPKTRHFRFG